MNEPADKAAQESRGPCTRKTGPRQFDRESSFRQLRALILGAQLAELRREVGVTRETLANRMGVTRAHVIRIEHGKASSVDQVGEYVAALGCRMKAIPEGGYYAMTVT